MPTADVSRARVPDSDSSERRWEQLLGNLTGLLPASSRCVLVDGPASQAALFASRLAQRLSGEQQVTLDASRHPDVRIFLRTALAGRPATAPEKEDRRAREESADIVIDLHDVAWPVMRRVAAPLAAHGPWYLAETRAFFACRAATWDAKFGDDLPAYYAAAAEAGIRRGGVVIDVGCGTGRALPPLREAVGPAGVVVAVDVTPEMLDVARPAAELAGAAMVVADARALPFADGSADAVFAAGLVNHLPDAVAGLRELARVTRPGGLLVLFHPSGRAALAARHGNTVSPGEPLSEAPLRRSTAAVGWHLTTYDDAPARFFAVAERR